MASGLSHVQLGTFEGQHCGGDETFGTFIRTVVRVEDPESSGSFEVLSELAEHLGQPIREHHDFTQHSVEVPDVLPTRHP